MRVPRQKLLTHVNQQFSVGVNHIVWHGWADQSPGAASQWPGFSPFGAFVSDVYGPQNPTFDDDKAVNTYVGRMQTILRRGKLRNDVADLPRRRRPQPRWQHRRTCTSPTSPWPAPATPTASSTTPWSRRPASTAAVSKPSRLGYKAFVLDNTDTAPPTPP